MMNKEPTILQLAAMDCFAIDGYKGTSMRTIAKSVEIQASSIYSHFSSKDDLFLSLIPVALQQEMNLAQKFFNDRINDDPRKTLVGYLENVVERYQLNASTRFILSVKYFPPQVHKEAIFEAINRHIESLRRLIEDTYERIEPRALSSELFSSAYISLSESLESELLYTNAKHFNERLPGIEALMSLVFMHNPIEEE